MAIDEQTTQETAGRGNYNEDKKTPVPPTVENITRYKNEQVLPLQSLEGKPVEQEHHWQKDHKCERVKEHVNNEWIKYSE